MSPKLTIRKVISQWIKHVVRWRVYLWGATQSVPDDHVDELQEGGQTGAEDEPHGAADVAEEVDAGVGHVVLHGLLLELPVEHLHPDQVLPHLRHRSVPLSRQLSQVHGGERGFARHDLVAILNARLDLALRGALIEPLADVVVRRKCAGIDLYRVTDAHARWCMLGVCRCVPTPGKYLRHEVHPAKQRCRFTGSNKILMRSGDHWSSCDWLRYKFG